jgi:hypothetical protein
MSIASVGVRASRPKLVPPWVPPGTVSLMDINQYFGPWEMTDLGTGGNASCQAGSTPTNCIPYIMGLSGLFLGAAIAQAQNPGSGQRWGQVVWTRLCTAPVNMTTLSRSFTVSVAQAGFAPFLCRVQVWKRTSPTNTVNINLFEANLGGAGLSGQDVISPGGSVLNFSVGHRLEIYLRFTKSAYAGAQTLTLGASGAITFIGYTV